MLPSYDGLAVGISRLGVGEGPAPDFTIAVEGKEWPVHKLVLFCHSDVLYKMSTNAAFIECQTGRVLLKDVEPRCVEAMIEFLYNQEYDIHSRGSFLPTPSELSKSAAAIEHGVSPGVSLEQVMSELYPETGGPDISDHEGSTAGMPDGSADGSVIVASTTASTRWANSGWGSAAKSCAADSRALPEFDSSEVDLLNFHLGVCILAECYNITGMKLAAETYIEEQFLNSDLFRNYEDLSSIVDKILDSDAPESMRRKVVEALVHRTESLHMDPKLTESDSLLDRRPELAVAMLKNIAKKRHIQRSRELQRNRGHGDYGQQTCYGNKNCPRHPSHSLCADAEWPEFKDQWSQREEPRSGW